MTISSSRLIAMWAIGGAIFGVLFPVAGWIWAIGTLDVTYAGIRTVHRQQPVMTIVACAPLVLAMAGAVVGFFHDRVHRALRSCEGVARERTSELERANNHLVDSITAKDQFVGTIGHELRTPVTAVIGFSEYLMTAGPDIGPEEVAEAVGLIASEGRQMRDLLDDLLVASRAELGSLSIDLHDLDLGELASECVRSAGRSPEWKARLTASLSPASVVADAGRVRQVLRNLLSNAERYGGPLIRVETFSDQTRGFLRVADNGAGVPREDEEAIFTPYGHSTGTATVSGSVGLGLSVSRTLARLMDGDLRYLRENGWTVFQLEIPTQRHPGPAPASPELASA